MITEDTGAAKYLPHESGFQFVNGSSATESGYQIYPLLIGLSGSSIISGMVIKEGAGGELIGYGTIGWLSVVLMALCIPVAAQLRPLAPALAADPAATALATEGT